MTINDEYINFMQDLEAYVHAENQFYPPTFFKMFKDVAFEAGYTQELEYTPYDKTKGLQVDGFHCDFDGSISNSSTSNDTLTIVISDFREEKDNIQSLNTDQINKLFKRAENFFINCTQEKFFKDLDETFDVYPLAYNIFKYYKFFKKVRVFIFSNARLATRMKKLETKVIEKISFTYNIFDFEEYIKLAKAKAGRTEIEIDFDNYNVNIPIINAGINSEEYSSMLFALPCDVLASIYDDYQAQLLEQNVRYFLQARGKTNPKIIKTLVKNPERFFAYNNGITATATELETKIDKKGKRFLAKIKNLQIVNGGQTTACCLYAREKEKADLKKAYVQVKLSIIKNDQLVDTIVKNIAEAANTQNKVHPADFFANHPFHTRMEKFSREIVIPVEEGAFSGVKWFYESKRGSYKDMTSYKSPAEIRKIKLEYPINKKIDKTDFAKHILTFNMNPNVVAKGAQAAFAEFAKYIDKAWNTNNNTFSKEWYKEAISKSIIFKGVDKIIKDSEWDFKAGGNKAVLTTYSIAWLTHYFQEKKLNLNFKNVWQLQQIDKNLSDIFLSIIPNIYEKMSNDAERVLAQEAKTKAPWDKLKVARFEVKKELIDAVTINSEDATMLLHQAQNEQALFNDVDIQIQVTELNIAGEWDNIEAYALNNRFMRADYNNILDKIRRGRPLTNRENKKIFELYQKCLEDGYSNE